MRKLSPNLRLGGAVAAVAVAVIIELAYRGWLAVALVALGLIGGFLFLYRPGQ